MSVGANERTTNGGSDMERADGKPRYTVITADSHCGADVTEYRPYLDARFHDEFDAWAATYEVPFADLLAPIRYRNWDSERRLAEHEADGIVAEVLFPNTVPPFFEESNLVALPPTGADYERRWAGVQAHNRWLADFCAAAPGRRAGIAQVFVNRLEDALAEIVWASEHIDLSGGILLPSVPPNSGLPELYDPVYDPLWRLCEERGIVVNVHSGAGLPDYGDLEIARAIMLVELPWFGHRPLWHLIFGGVFERFPGLRVSLTEQGVAWLPRGLETLDWFYGRMAGGSAAESLFFGAAAGGMSMKPSEYFAAQRVDRCVVPPLVGVGPPSGVRSGPDHVGRRLPALGGDLAVQPTGAAGGLCRRRSRRGPSVRRCQRGGPLRVRPRGARAACRRVRPDRGRDRRADRGPRLPGSVDLERIRHHPGAAGLVTGLGRRRVDQRVGWMPYSASHHLADAAAFGSAASPRS